MKKKSIVDHIAILVEDLKVAEEWYCSKIDCKVTYRDKKYVRLKTESTNIALIHKDFYQHAHFAILVDKKEDLPTESGQTVKHRDGTIGVYVKDPFGNYLEYIWYSEKSKEVFLSE